MMYDFARALRNIRLLSESGLDFRPPVKAQLRRMLQSNIKIFPALENVQTAD